MRLPFRKRSSDGAEPTVTTKPRAASVRVSWARLLPDYTVWIIDRAGPLNIAAIVIAVGAVTILGGRTASLDQSNAALRKQVAKAEREARLARAGAKRNPDGPEDQLREFYQRFPPLPAAAELLGRLEAIATTQGLALEAGDYQLVRDDRLRLQRYQVTLPLRGSYSQVRPFLHEALKAVPTAVLESVTIKRDRVDSPKVEAQVRLVILLGPGTVGHAAPSVTPTQPRREERAVTIEPMALRPADAIASVNPQSASLVALNHGRD